MEEIGEQLVKLSSLLEESEELSKKRNLEEEASKREEREYMERRKREEEALIFGSKQQGFIEEIIPNKAAPIIKAVEVEDEKEKDLLGKQAKKQLALDKLDITIWNTEELELFEENIDKYLEDQNNDNREIPEFDFLFKHKVSSTDVYLGLDFEKNPSAQNSDVISVMIKLPKVNGIDEIDLQITSILLKLFTKDYKLITQFPNKVLDKQAQAQWNSKSKILQLNIPIDKF
ncbi:hypothetical protein ABK040_004000 [Willaertia magna]